MANASVGSLVLGFSNLRRAQGERPLVITSGEGIFVRDEDGREYIEASSSFYCAALGYSEERLIDAAARQMRRLPFYTSAQHRTVPVAMELADRLAALAPIDNAHVAFGSTGSEANDFLVKFMRYRNVFRGEPRRRKIISRRGGYHGSTNMTASLGGSKSLHDSFALAMDDHLLVSQPDFPLNAEDGETRDAFVDRLVRELEVTIQDADPETVGAFICEPVSFASGFYPPPPGYFERVQAMLHKYDILYFDDEVITGYGRTGNMFGAQTFGIEPDCMVVAKGMSAAYFPISAIIMSERFYGDIEGHSDAASMFAHAGTYSAHPVGAAVALEVLDIFEERALLAHVRARAKTFARHLEGLRGHPRVADVRSLGLAGAVQLHSDTPAGGATAVLQGPGKALAEAVVDRGLLVRVNGPTAVIAPPLIITDDEIAELFARFARALDDVDAALAA